MENIADLRTGLYLLGILKGNLQAVVLHFLHHFLFRITEKITGFPVALNLHIIGLAEMILAGCDQRIFDGFKKRILTDLLLFLQNIQCFH